MNVILKISIVLLVGIVGGKVAKIFKLPNVSGYLVFGLLLGPSITNFITINDNNSFTIISELALSVIAFSIGSEFLISEMKKVGKTVVIITLAEVVGAVFVVFGVMYFLLNQSFVFSIVLASMSAATAPAATLLVIRQYRAHGPLTKTVLPVVALDDVFGIVFFGIAMAVAKISINVEEVSVIKMVAIPFIEILGSIGLGLGIGFILTYFSKKAKNHDEVQVIALAAIGITTGVSTLLGFSPLLSNIVVGTVLVNTLKNSQRVYTSVSNFINPFYVLFFTLAGASLELDILLSIGVVGVAYIFARGLGKYIGAFFGSNVAKAPKQVVRYLGFALLPQGGISIGLSVLVRQQLPDYAVAITTVVMFGVLIYEVTGPIFAKIAISKADEINGLDKLMEVN